MAAKLFRFQQSCFFAAMFISFFKRLDHAFFFPSRNNLRRHIFYVILMRYRAHACAGRYPILAVKAMGVLACDILGTCVFQGNISLYSYASRALDAEVMGRSVS